MTKEKHIIFDLTNSKNNYKGVLFAEMDHLEAGRRLSCPFPPPPADYCVGIMGIIWVDEDGIWNAKIRLKFPSGNKQVICRRYDQEHKENININETYVLNDIYQMPMKHKHWLRNESGTPEGIVELIQQADMIESFRIEERA